MSGWNKRYGELTVRDISDDEYWSHFIFVFSEACHKRNTYKYGLVKAILDNLFNAHEENDLFYIPYSELFGKFAENYWNLIVKYHLKQMIKNTQSEYSAIEKIYMDAVNDDPELANIEFSSIDESMQRSFISKVSVDCRKYVVGALYEDLAGTIYSFDLSEYDGIYISKKAYVFLMKYKSEIEKLNYYAWAQFLEKINDESVLVKLIDKLDLATPVRKDLSVFRLVLQREFEENTCFYCGRKLSDNSDVDHFIPWKFVKTDNLWNFVLACKSCNSRKNDRIPDQSMLQRVILRNQNMMIKSDPFVQKQFQSYDERIFKYLWKYAQMNGYRVMEKNKQEAIN